MLDAICCELFKVDSCFGQHVNGYLIGFFDFQIELEIELPSISWLRENSVGISKGKS
jgi:hypothetical protein